MKNKKYDFDNVVNRINTGSLKYSEGPNVLPMWVADMDYHVLPEIKESILNTAEVDAYGYKETLDDYFKAYQSFYKRRHNVDFEVDEAIFSLGVVASIDSIFRHHFKKSDKVLVFTPVYHIFFHCIENNELGLVELPLKYENSEYKLDLNEVEKVIKNQDIKVLLLCNPNNPTGNIYTLDELNTLAKLCFENKVLLISDEIHGEIVDNDTKYNSILNVETSYLQNVVALFSGSKVFNIAGLQSSLIVTKNKKLRESIQEGVYKDDIGEPNYFVVNANIAAFTKGDDYIYELNDYIFENKKYVEEFLKKSLPNLKYIKTKATYLLWVDISYYSNDSVKFAVDLKRKTGLYVSNGAQFKGNGNNFIRINVATSLANVKLAMSKLKQYISDTYKDK